MKTVRGIFYFPTHAEAESYSRAHGFAAAGEVIRYDLGYAVQACPSGPYAGTDLPALEEALQAAARSSWQCLAEQRAA